jgi:L-cysteine S-thiosulfotransferase
MSLKQRVCAPALAYGLFGAAVLGPVAAWAESADALTLARQNCEQCHQIRGLQNFGNIGPSLLDLKDRYAERKDVAAIIFDETKRNPQTAMPPFGRNLILNTVEIETLVNYLYDQ